MNRIDHLVGVTRSGRIGLVFAALTLAGFAPSALAQKVAPSQSAPSVTSNVAPAKGKGVAAVKAANQTIAAQLAQRPAAGSDAEKKLAQEVTTTLRGFLDLDELAKRAVDQHWGKMSESQRKSYLELLRSLLEDNYIRGVRSNLAYSVEYIGEAPAPSATAMLVLTKINAKRKGRPYSIKVDYTVEADAKGAVHVVDIATDGVGLIDNYREQFNKIIAKDGVDGLLAKMKKKQSAAKK
jgi:phospholipid transport system substrate-binding protein